MPPAHIRSAAPIQTESFDVPNSHHPLRHPPGLRAMASAVGRLQRVLWPLGTHRACARNHCHDLGTLFRRREPVHALVAESGGALLGLTHYLFHRSTTMIEPNCYLQDLFTSAAARGKGVGRALINGVYEQARLAGGSRVYWQTHETNHTAMQLYDKVAERSGFIVYRKLF
jgi:GNAT superfamily N-acetyltransferase